MLDISNSAPESNSNEFKHPKQQLAVIPNLIRQLGLDRIKNRKFRRFVVNTAVALSFLTAMPPKVDASGFGCIVTNSNTTNVNIRDGAGTNYAIEGILTPTDVANYRYTQNGWHLIENGSTTGWVSEGITKIVNCNEAEQMIEGLNDNSGVELTPREYPDDNLIIFGEQEVLTDEQVLN